MVVVNCDYLQQYDGKYIELNNNTKNYLEQHYQKFMDNYEN